MGAGRIRTPARQRCHRSQGWWGRPTGDGGQTALEYLGTLAGVLLLVAAVAAATVPRQVSDSIADGVCRVVHAAGFGGGCDTGNAAQAGPASDQVGPVSREVKTGTDEVGRPEILNNLPPTEGDGPAPLFRGGDDPFEPAKCLLSEEQTKDTVVVDILFIKISGSEYKANTDWWNASLGIGLGISAGQVSLGFKLFGIDITHEHRQQTITDDPEYATAPHGWHGARPWTEWKKCTQTSPIT